MTGCIAFLQQESRFICMRSCRCPFRVPLDVPYLPSEVEIGPQAQPKQAAHTAAAAAPQNANAETDSGHKVSKSSALHSFGKSVSLHVIVPTL